MRLRENTEISISLTELECGSYEVRNNDYVIGYVVKPFVVDLQGRESHIAQFEKLVWEKYSHFYNKFYRAYWFLDNNASDTVMEVVMIPRHADSMGNWQCEEQEVEIYARGKRSFDKMHPQFITYNCSKRRLKVLGDGD